MSVSDALRDVLEMMQFEGVKPESIEGQYRINTVKIDHCKTQHSVTSCGQCSFRENCDILKYQVQVAAKRMDPANKNK